MVNDNLNASSDPSVQDLATTPRPEEVGPGGFQKLQSAVRGFEREYLLRALRLSGGKKMRAAELLGISRKSLWEKLRAYGVSTPRPVTVLNRENERELEREAGVRNEAAAGKGSELY